MAVLVPVFLILLIGGAPIAVGMGLSAVIAFVTTTDMPAYIVAQRMQYGVDSFAQLAIPFFILAGHFMNIGGISRRIVDFCTSLVGHLKGGLAQVMVLACCLISGISGSAYADCSMLGTVLIPEMKEKNYPLDSCTVLLAAGTTVGPIIPPSIQLVIFGVTASVSVGQLLVGGVVPGLVMGLCLMIIVYFIARKEKWPGIPKATWGQRWKTFKQSIFAFIMPMVVIGGMLGGAFTPTEAAVIATLFAFLVGKFIYKKISFKAIFPVCKEVFRQTAQITFIIACAAVVGWLMTKEQIPAILSKALLGVSSSPVVILLIINLILLILGCFMETTAIVLLMTPVLMPVIKGIGMDPVHFGVWMILNLCIGLLTPPVGMLMYISCGISGCSIKDFIKKLPPYLLALLVALMITVFYEPVTMGLVRLLF